MKKLVLIVALALSLMAEMSFDQVQELIKKKQYNEALVSLDVIQKKNPNESIVYYTKAQALAGTGDLRGAKNALDMATALNSKLSYVKPESVVALKKAIEPRTELVQSFERADKTNYWLLLWFGLIIATIAGLFYRTFRKKHEDVAEPVTAYKCNPTYNNNFKPETHEKSTIKNEDVRQEVIKKYRESENVGRRTVRPEIRPYNQERPVVKEVHHHYNRESHYNRGSSDSVVAGIGGFVAGAVIADMINDNDIIDTEKVTRVTEHSTVQLMQPKTEEEVFNDWKGSNESVDTSYDDSSSSWSGSNDDSSSSWSGSNDDSSSSWSGSNDSSSDSGWSSNE